MHSKEPARLQNFTGYAGNRKRRCIGSEYSFIVIDRCQLAKQVIFCFYVFNNGFNNEIRYTLCKIIGKMDALKYFSFLPGCYFTFFNKRL